MNRGVIFPNLVSDQQCVKIVSPYSEQSTYTCILFVRIGGSQVMALPGNTPPPPPTHKTPETWETHQKRGKPTEHKIPSDGAQTYLSGIEGVV
jgi:hypothetical protein